MKQPYTAKRHSGRLFSAQDIKGIGQLIRAQRHRNLWGIVNDARFLILPWIRVSCLACRVLPQHWEQRYGYRAVRLETFVETGRFQGSCHRAANWRCLEPRQGRGKLGDHRFAQMPVKTVWVYPLARDFRQSLCR